MVGERLARAALALGYNRSSTLWAGPVPTTIALSGSGEMTIKFTEGGGTVASALEFISCVRSDFDLALILCHAASSAPRGSRAAHSS